MTIEDDPELIPAATVLLLRDGPESGALEVLMLRRNSKIAFGGAWVFPGGRVDDEERIADDALGSARVAAVREVGEETGLDIAAHHLETWSYWVPPKMPSAPTRGPRRRFSTWFFVTTAPAGEVAIDHGEINEDRWYRPAEAIGWATNREPEEFRTRPIAKQPPTVAWTGDAAYEGGSADVAGPRHRLLMLGGGWVYQRT